MRNTIENGKYIWMMGKLGNTNEIFGKLGIYE
jgi:hypothetical protein